MLLSVIIPVYNVEEYLEQCLNSIISQPYKNLEIICVNDASTDSSLEILKKYSTRDSRIIIINNPDNMRSGESRNIGLRVAKGDYIHFMDSDDWLEDDVYTKFITMLKEFSNPDVLYFQFKTFDNVSKIFKLEEYKNKNILNTLLNPQKDEIAFDNWDRYVSKLYKRSFLTDNNIFFNNYPTMEDIEYAALVYTNCKSIVYTDIVGFNYRINRPNSVITKATKHIDKIIKSVENNEKLCENLPEEIKKRLLGFDYYLVRHAVDDAYRFGDISLFELVKFSKRINAKGVEKYIHSNYFPHEYKSLKICVLKMMILKLKWKISCFCRKCKNRLKKILKHTINLIL